MPPAARMIDIAGRSPMLTELFNAAAGAAREAANGPRYRHALPQLTGKPFLSDGGLETTLIFHDGLELPYFASVTMLRRPGGPEILDAYYRRYLEIARAAGVGFILDSVTWRASPDWGAKLGYDLATLAQLNREAIQMLHPLRHAFESDATPVVVGGIIGPRGDGYVAGAAMTVDEAADYGRFQADLFAEAGADMVAAMTMTNAAEAAGYARAAAAAGLPSCISFTLETDARLPSGEDLGEAIGFVERESGGAPAYYMVNCAHPTHFDTMLAAAVAADAPWLAKLRGLRANASKRSHAELDASTDLDAGDPDTLGREYAALRARHGRFTVLGGCCGTDHRHVAAIARTCLAA
jgi:S-methylmethionine-dependent homocysteine/selenocysteine methylase